MHFETERYTETFGALFCERIYKTGAYPYLYLFRNDVRHPNIGEIREMIFWCADQFGHGAASFDKGARWAFLTSGMFGFQQENDAFAFKMRWC